LQGRNLSVELLSGVERERFLLESNLFISVTEFNLTFSINNNLLGSVSVNI
jgi:hypothetical protein